MTINWIQFPLHPDTPAEGMALSELFPGRDLTPMKERMRGLMAEAGLPYGNRSHTYNSRLAQELGKWADTENPEQAETLHRALFHAYFVDAVNLAEGESLLAIVDKAGLDRSRASEVLSERSYTDAVDADWRKSRETGVTGVPTFVSQDLMVVGCQPYATLERFVLHLQDRKSI